MPLSCTQPSRFSHFRLCPTGLTTALRSTILARVLWFHPQPFLQLLCETGLVDRNNRISLSGQSALYRLTIVNPLSYFPSLALPKLASKRTLDTLASLQALASLTIFPSHYRKNGHFQTSAPALLKHSLSFTLRLFSIDHPPHADFDVWCDIPFWKQISPFQP